MTITTPHVDINPLTTAADITAQIVGFVVNSHPFRLGRYELVLKGSCWMVSDYVDGRQNIDGISEGDGSQCYVVAEAICKAWYADEWASGPTHKISFAR